MSIETITIKEVEFNKAAICSMSRTINKMLEDEPDVTKSFNNLSAKVGKKELEIIKPYVDHHSEDLEKEKTRIMKPIKSSIHDSIDSVYPNSKWDSEFLTNLNHENRNMLLKTAQYLQMIPLIDKLAIYIAYHLKKTLDTTKIENLDETKMYDMFKNELNINLPNAKVVVNTVAEMIEDESESEPVATKTK